MYYERLIDFHLSEWASQDHKLDKFKIILCKTNKYNKERTQHAVSFLYIEKTIQILHRGGFSLFLQFGGLDL